MESGPGESTQDSQPSNASNNEAGSFECNICFDLAQDPIVTLCGHLYCWPCLYKWLQIHAHSPECPVCKAVIQEEKLVPLYGRGKTASDPRSRSVPGVDIPQRPTGQRPETAQPHEHDHFHNHHHHYHPQQHGLGLMGGFPQMAAQRWGNFAFSAGIGGLFPSLFNFHVHGFPDASAYGAGAEFPYGFPNTFHGRHMHGYPRPHGRGQQADSHLTVLLAIVGVLVVLALMGLYIMQFRWHSELDQLTLLSGMTDTTAAVKYRLFKVASHSQVVTCASIRVRSIHIRRTCAAPFIWAEPLEQKPLKSWNGNRNQTWEDLQKAQTHIQGKTISLFF